MIDGDVRREREIQLISIRARRMMPVTVINTGWSVTSPTDDYVTLSRDGGGGT